MDFGVKTKQCTIVIDWRFSRNKNKFNIHTYNSKSSEMALQHTSALKCCKKEFMQCMSENVKELKCSRESEVEGLKMK